MLHLIRSILNEVTGLYKLTFIGRLFHYSFVHVFISLIDALHRALAPFIDLLLKLVLDLESLVAKTSFHASCNNSEKREVNNIVGQIQNLVVSNIIMVNLFSQFF
jgi:hypothetical protein